MIRFRCNGTGNVYEYKGVAKMKNPKGGDWSDCIMYSRDGHIYCREVVDFFRCFTLIDATNCIMNAANDLYSIDKAEKGGTISLDPPSMAETN